MEHSEPQPKDFDLVKLILLTLGLIVAVCIFSGCMNANKVNKWLDKEPKSKTQPVIARYLTLNELFSATYCKDEFPVEESEVIPGKEETKEEVKEEQPVTIPCKDSEGNHKEAVICPSNKTIIKMISRTDTIKVRDRAAERALMLENVAKTEALIAEKEAHLATLEKLTEVKKERNYAYIALAIIAVFFILAVLRKLSII